jgi:hypothetical protein
MEPGAVPVDDLPMTTSATIPNPTDRERRADSRRDAANRERYALRRAIRDSQYNVRQRQRELAAFDADVDAAKRTIEQDWRLLHWGKDAGRPLAWRAAASAGPRRQVSERRISWQALRRGARVIGTDGARVGAVEYVLADVRLDIFDGVVIDTRWGPGGRRFVDAADIAAIFHDRIELNLPATEARDLPRPSRNPGALRHQATDPMPSSLRLQARRARDRLARLARPRAWSRRSRRNRRWDA